MWLKERGKPPPCVPVQAVAHLHPVDLRVVPSEGHVVGDALVLSCQGIGLPIKPPTTNTVKQTYLL